MKMCETVVFHISAKSEWILAYDVIFMGLERTLEPCIERLSPYSIGRDIKQ